MFKLKCADMGSVGCDHVVTDETREGVTKKMMEHAQASHPDKMAEMEKMSDEERAGVMQKMDSAITEE